MIKNAFIGISSLIFVSVICGGMKKIGRRALRICEYSNSKKLKKSKKKKKKKKKKTKKKSSENIAYYKIPVDFEIKGNFLGYIKFKRALSLSKKMLNFDKESIKVIKGDTTGAIRVNGTLTIVGLDG